MYRPIATKKAFVEHSELDTHICNRVQWTRILAFPSELESNETHYSYTINDLKPRTRYVCLVKSFGLADIHDTGSDLIYITTTIDLPAPPTINVTQKTDVSLTIQLEHSDDDAVSHYKIEIYDLPDNELLLDHRDFCVQPSYMYHDTEVANRDEDDDACCRRKEEEADDHRFVHNMHKLFECNLDKLENCARDTNLADVPPDTVLPNKAMRRINLDAASGGTITIRHLDPFRLYTLQVQSCNKAGCGAYAFHWTRTNFSKSGDSLEKLSACRVNGLNEFHVYFPEPQRANGVITSYVVHFRLYQPDKDTFRSHIECVTRLHHAFNNFQLIAQLDRPFNEVAVRVYSLAGGFITPWMPITLCSFQSAAIKMSAVNDHTMGLATKIFITCFLFGASILIVRAYVRWGLWRWQRFAELSRYLSRIWNREPRRQSDPGQSLVEYRNVPEEERLENLG